MIPFFQPRLPETAAQAAARHILAGELTTGYAVAAFEAALCLITGRKHAICTSSGTAALMVVAKIMQEIVRHIVVPDYGVASVPNAFTWMGFDVIFCPIDETGCMNAQAMEAIINTNGNVVVCWVDFSGRVGMERNRTHTVCTIAGVPFIEDACCAIHVPGAATVGDFSVLSFSTPKMIATGQGGAILTDDDDLARLARNHVTPGGKSGGGTNLRLGDVAAAIGLSQCGAVFDDNIDRRTRQWRLLRDLLNGQLYGIPNGVPLHNIVFTANGNGRALLRRSLSKAGVVTLRNYQSAYSQFGAVPIPGLETGPARRWEECAVYLPFGLGLEDDQIIQIADAIKGSNISVTGEL